MHIVRSTSLKYSKIRQFQEHFQFDVCRHEVRYGCLREDSCHFAHSFIELKVWLLQQYSGEGAARGRAGPWQVAQGDSCSGGAVSGRGCLCRSRCPPDITGDAEACSRGASRLGRSWVDPYPGIARGTHMGKGEEAEPDCLVGHQQGHFPLAGLPFAHL